MQAKRVLERGIQRTVFVGVEPRCRTKGQGVRSVSIRHSSPCARLMTAIVWALLPVLLTACSDSKQDASPPKDTAPPCIALVENASVITETDGPRALKWETQPVLIPLAVYVSGRWLSPSIFDGSQGKTTAKTPISETSFWESMATGTFHAVGVPESKLTPSRKVQYEGWGGALLAGLACIVEGPDKLVQSFAVKEEGDEGVTSSDGVLVVNRPGIPGDVAPSKAGLRTEEIKEIAHEGLSSAYARFLDVVKPAPMEHSPVFGIPFDSELKIEEIHRFRITQEQEGVWVSVAVKWPQGIRIGDTVRKEWEGGYYGILRINSGEKYEPLWESAYFDQPEYPQVNARFYDFVGSGDGDGDGVNEVVMTESYIEAMEYQVYALVNWSTYSKVATAARQGP